MTQDAQLIKFRLIGAAVVIVGITLAWWLLLDNDVKRYQETRETIPARIDIERFDVEKPQAVSSSKVEKETVAKEPIAVVPTQEKPKTEQAAVDAKPAPIVKPEAVIKPEPALKQEKKIQHDEVTGMPIAYVVQVGSFGKFENADQLKKRLLEKQLPAYVKRFNLEQGTIYRVLIGPKLAKERAEELLPFIKLELNLDGQVLRYKPGFEE